MKNKVSFLSLVHHFFLISLLSVMAALVGESSARAGLTVDIHTYRYPYSFVAYGWLTTNATPPAAPFGDYLISSPNGSFLRYQYDTNGLNYITGGGIGTTDFSTFMGTLTNGQWSIQVTNASSTNTYFFNVTATGLNSNLFNPATITNPANNSQNVTNNPTFAWSGGPIGWLGNAEVTVHDLPYNYYESASLPPSATSWNTPNPPLPLGTNVFHLVYLSNATATVVASIPRDIGSNAIGGWVSTAHLDVNSEDVEFIVGTGVAASASLFGHYTFDDQFYLEEDSSGLANHAEGMFFTGGSTQSPQYTASGIVGGAIEFDGENAVFWETNMVNVLSGSYSISLWLETSQSYGGDNDDGRDGAAIFAGDDTGDFPVPMALTGDKAGFHTAVPDHTINSSNSVNSGSFTHLVVTRDAATGLKRIYVNGVLDVSGTGGTAAGIDSSEVYLGYSYYSGQGIVGAVDDLQVYTGLLNASQIDFLYNNPGATAPISGGVGGHTNIAHYRFDNGNDLGHDDSANNNNFSSSSSWGLPVHEYDQVGAVGSGGVRFYGVSSMVHAPPNPVFTNITEAIADSFSLSLWVRTTEVVGNDTDDAFDGAVVIWHYASGTDDNIPVSITGNKVAFHTGDEFGNSQTLHSTNDVTDGNDHHIVVTRDRITGVKKIYVNGVLEATAIGTTRLLNQNTNYFSIGGVVGHSFDGTVDDVQIYSGVLSATEVASLYNNPGNVVTNTTGGGGGGFPNNISITFDLGIVRSPDAGGVFYCYPIFNSVSPAPITTYEVASPNNLCSGGLNTTGSTGFVLIEDMLNEITNGLWTVYINRNDPSEQQFHFSITSTGVSTNQLKHVNIISPVSGSTGLSAFPNLSWNGANGLDSLFVGIIYTNSFVQYTNLAATDTNWFLASPLSAGTNSLYVSYQSYSVANFTITVPVDSFSVSLSNWNASASIRSQASSEFVVTANGINPVQLANPNRTGGNFQFQFLSQSGKTNTVQSRTNLSLGVWVNRTNVLGDGSTKTVILPVSSAPEEFFRVSTE